MKPLTKNFYNKEWYSGIRIVQLPFFTACKYIKTLPPCTRPYTITKGYSSEQWTICSPWFFKATIL